MAKRVQAEAAAVESQDQAANPAHPEPSEVAESPMERAMRIVAESAEALRVAQVNYETAISDQFNLLPEDQRQNRWREHLNEAAKAGMSYYNGKILDSDFIPEWYKGRSFVRATK